MMTLAMKQVAMFLLKKEDWTRKQEVWQGYNGVVEFLGKGVTCYAYWVPAISRVVKLYNNDFPRTARRVANRRKAIARHVLPPDFVDIYSRRFIITPRMDAMVDNMGVEWDKIRNEYTKNVLRPYLNDNGVDVHDLHKGNLRWCDVDLTWKIIDYDSLIFA